MATICKTVYNRNLVTPFSITVKCAGEKKEFRWHERQNVGEWLMKIWKDQEDGIFNIHSPAYVFYNIDWDADNVLYAKYELKGE